MPAVSRLFHIIDGVAEFQRPAPVPAAFPANALAPASVSVVIISCNCPAICLISSSIIGRVTMDVEFVDGRWRFDAFQGHLKVPG